MMGSGNTPNNTGRTAVRPYWEGGDGGIQARRYDADAAIANHGMYEQNKLLG